MTGRKAARTDGAGPETSDVPIDRGWAWVILAAAWVSQFLCVGVYKTLGILFVEFQRKYSSSSSLTALVFSLLNFGVSITSLCMMNFGLRYVTTRQSVMTGSIIVCAANIMGAYAKNIEVIIMSQGLLVGIGEGLMFATSLSYLAQHFKRRLGFANGIAATGGSVGSLLFPIILRACLDEYGLFGTLWILGAIFLQGLVAGALMRPTESYIRRNKRKTTRSQSSNVDGQEMDECNAKNDHDNDNDSGVFVKNTTSSKDGYLSENSPEQGEIGDSDVTLLQHPAVPNTCYKPDTRLAEPLLVSDTSQMSPFTANAIMARKRRHDTVCDMSEHSQRSRGASFIDAISESSVARYASNELFPSALGENTTVDVNRHKQTDTKHNTPPGCFVNTTFLVKMCSVLDCSVLKRLPLLFFLPSAALLCCSSSIAMSFLPPLGVDRGLTDTQTSLLITIIGAVDLCALTFWGFIADTGWLRRHHIISLASMLLAVATFCMPLYTDFTGLLIYSVIYGLLGRLYFSLYPVVLVDFLGVEKLRGALGIMVLVHALSLAIMLPTAGYLRDSTGTYIPSFQVLATFMAIGGLGILTLPLAERCERRVSKPTNKDDGVC